jgi:type I restriction enzyme R subunit
MTNFGYLLKIPAFAGFAKDAITAEQIINFNPSASVTLCRKAMERAVKWMYAVDPDLTVPYDDKLSALLNTYQFRDIVDPNVYRRLEFIRKLGNAAAHSASSSISKEQAELCLENLYYFFDYLVYVYMGTDRGVPFNPKALERKPRTKSAATSSEKDVTMEQLIKENERLKAQLAGKTEKQRESYVPVPINLSEFKTRKIYIDTDLEESGWLKGRDWIEEMELAGMPNQSATGYADYALLDDDSTVLAVIEAKNNCTDPSKGRQQLKLYCDLIEQKQGYRPVGFLSNGFDNRIIDNRYPERKVAQIYSKRDLQKLRNLQTMRESLNHIQIDENIAGRYYQKQAVKAVCDAFEKNRRKALLVMATGSGKTRTIISLVKVLQEKGWVKNVLFLADRRSLVTQAKRSFSNLMKDLSVTDLCESNPNYDARCVLSTYQSIMNAIDTARDDKGKIFSPGHFDLVICDEAHRSIYNKYKDIFDYFDAPLVGLTATPKDEVEKNTYEIFELENGVPTYGYELAQAVKDGFLVDFQHADVKVKFLEQGIVYDQLSEEEKEDYEKTFAEEDGTLPESIDASALNSWVFNEDTIKEVLFVVMQQGLKIDYSSKLGKTIIFAKNHKHAEKILEVFNKEYPELPGFAKVIDNYTNYAQSLIDEFSEPEKLPQIAISVDMLDTGIDVPEILNLVFFKKVMSKAKFWQMIGRGTRLSPGLMDGQDKNKFYIFDFCGNFEFFQMNNGSETPIASTLQERLFNLQFEMVYKLQDLQYQTEDLVSLRNQFVSHLSEQVKGLNRSSFAVKQHIKHVDKFANPENYSALTFQDVQEIKEEVSPLIAAIEDDAAALRFDSLAYSLELARLSKKPAPKARADMQRMVKSVSKIANIPQIREKAPLIRQILQTEYLENANVMELESVRTELRNLMKYVKRTDRPSLETNYNDEVESVEWHESELRSNDLQNYREKAEFYLKKHLDNPAVYKLKHNQLLDMSDIFELEKILYEQIGSKSEYQEQNKDKDLGVFVREIVGLDMNAAKQAFSSYLDETRLNDQQIYFVNQIVEYIVRNGILEDTSVLKEAPFNDKGSLGELFGDNMPIWDGIMATIKSVNQNSNTELIRKSYQSKLSA